ATPSSSAPRSRSRFRDGRSARPTPSLARPRRSKTDGRPRSFRASSRGATMSDFLSRMAAGSRARVADARARLGERALVRRARLRPPPPRLSLPPRFDVIAEIKPASPAAGRLAPIGPGGGDALIARARRYARAGAFAISVLTEPSAFGGS